jgi:uncharacterized membrane protein
MPRAHENLDERLLHRMLFFTDAMFAIVMTVLVLEVRPPEIGWEPTADAVATLAGHIGAFAMSFALIAIFWIAHMNTTRRLNHFDWPTALANMLFLFPVCLLPFVSAWLGREIGGAVTWMAYATVLVATSAANILLVLVMSRDGGRLVAEGMTRRERAYRLVRAAAPGIAFGIGLLNLFFGVPFLSYFCWALIPLAFWLAGVFFKPQPIAA